MSKGKTAAQAGHAAISAAEIARKQNANWFKAWLDEGQCKIVVKVKGVKELLNLERQAKELRLPCAMITDRGLTEIPPGTITCLAIGPAPVEQLDRITGKLPLL